MHPPKVLLIPIDFTSTTSRLIEVALEIARAYEAKLVLMHAFFIPPMPYSGPFTWVTDELRAAAQASLDQELAKLAAAYPRCDSILRAGDPRDAILAAAHDSHADWIVMGTLASGARRLLLGSVADQIIRRSPIPVLCVPPPPQQPSAKVAQEQTRAATL